MVQKSQSQPPDMYETLQIMGYVWNIYHINRWVCRISSISTNQIAFAGPTCRLLLQDVTFPKDLTRFGSPESFLSGKMLGEEQNNKKTWSFLWRPNGKKLDVVWIQ